MMNQPSRPPEDELGRSLEGGRVLQPLPPAAASAAAGALKAFHPQQGCPQELQLL